ncbi:MAG: hypothetical protein GWN58_25800 [Anaerolineae bacterium]|nr:hypothetical protein [Anaerolineae bacterium]
MQSMKEAFDQAFTPYNPELLPPIPGKPEMMRVNGHLVSQEYCGICRSDGPCVHKDDLEGLLQEQDRDDLAATYEAGLSVGVQ